AKELRSKDEFGRLQILKIYDREVTLQRITVPLKCEIPKAVRMMKVEDKTPAEDGVATRKGIGKRKRRAMGNRRGDRIRGGPSAMVETFNGSRDDEDCNNTKAANHIYGGRVLRSRRYRRPFEDKPIKRLFTPEIKRFLKGWLVRRRENPYPSREEKKELSRQTALTYVQICNWFANWRRKLKNAAEEANLCEDKSHDLMNASEASGSTEDRSSGGRVGTGGRRKGRTWGNLIRRYNSRAQGNVEQFSITSDDSIWEEPEENVDVEEEGCKEEEMAGTESCGESRDSEEHWATMEHSYSILLDRPKCRHRFPTPPTEDADRMERGIVARGRGKSYRVRSTLPTGCRKGSYDATSSDDESYDGDGYSHSRKKVHSGGMQMGVSNCVATGGTDTQNKCIARHGKKCSVVSKWLESACAYDERKRNSSSVDGSGGTPVQLKWAARNVTWSTGDNKMDGSSPWILSRVEVNTASSNACHWSVAGRHREELDAAETLALLAATALP
ncbi:hypothetical protein J437_LFUL011388, partial [Ladona fulva]